MKMKTTERKHGERRHGLSTRCRRLVATAFSAICLVLIGFCAYRAHLANQSAGTLSDSSSGAGISTRLPTSNAASGALMQKLTTIVHDALRETEASEARAFQDFEKSFEQAGDHFDAATEQVEPLLKDVMRPGTCVRICRLAMSDIMRNEQRTEAFLNEIFTQHVGRHCAEGIVETEHALRAFHEELCRQDILWRTRVSAELDQLAAPPQFDMKPIKKLARNMTPENRRIREIASGSAWSVTGLGMTAIEEVFSRKITKLVVAIVKRFMGKSLVSGSVAASDGPLPVGDCIAAGLMVAFVAWDGYELHKARMRLPRQLRGKLIDGIDACRDDTRRSATARAKEFLKTFRENRKAVAAELLLYNETTDSPTVASPTTGRNPDAKIR